MRSQTDSARPAIVLIVSKHEWTSRSLESILVPSGRVVLKTFTSRQTLELVQQQPPDAIIIDVHLPEGDGLALCRELRDHQLVSPSTPVLLTMPKSPTRRERLEALRAGAWDCLGNPLDAEELLAMLDALIPAKLDADQARTEGLVDETLGLYNALGLARRAQELAAHATRHHAPLACVLFAPDPGPETAEGAPTDGQRLVWERVAGVLKSASRVSDAVGRLGEGVFGVIALDAGAAHARTLAERLAGAMLDPRKEPLAERVPRFRLHAGCHAVSDFGTAAIDTVELMLRATTALQRARSDPTGPWLREYDESHAAPDLRGSTGRS